MQSILSNKYFTYRGKKVKESYTEKEYFDPEAILAKLSAEQVTYLSQELLLDHQFFMLETIQWKSNVAVEEISQV